MLRDEAVAVIAARCGNRTDLDARIVLELKLAQGRLESDGFLPFFLVSELASASTTNGQEQITFPTTFLRELDPDDSVFLIFDADGNEYDLRKADYQWMRRELDPTGRPSHYTILGKYFRLRPVPDAVYSLQFMFYQQDTVLDTNIENQWLKYAPNLLIAEAGARVAAFIGNQQAQQLFTSEIAIEQARLVNAETARREANRDRTMGDD